MGCVDLGCTVDSQVHSWGKEGTGCVEGGVGEVGGTSDLNHTASELRQPTQPGQARRRRRRRLSAGGGAQAGEDAHAAAVDHGAALRRAAAAQRRQAPGGEGRPARGRVVGEALEQVHGAAATRTRGLTTAAGPDTRLHHGGRAGHAV
jgi:hypothetical protein